ncbi:MAG: cytochrome ubiquinol oxidase subunit I [Methanotrichaceae archaeon]
MIKLTLLILALAAFFLILILYVVPNQGGLISSTELQQSDLQSAALWLKEYVPIQEVDLGKQGRSMFIAIAMLEHVVLANLQLGGAWIIPLTEFLWLRSKKNRFRRLARSQTLFNVIFFSIGATFAIGGMLFFAGLFPVLVQNAFHIYWWPLFVEALTFAGEIFFLFSYWYTWDKISPRWHQFLGWANAVDVFFQQLFINTLAAGMLTPGAPTIEWGQTGFSTMPFWTLVSWWSNTTVWVLTFHRLAGAVSMYGYVLAVIAIFHYTDRKDWASKAYWDWVATFGMAFGLLGLAFQPGFGLMYMMQIMYHSQLAFTYIMHGPRAWEMLLMVVLLATLLISSLIYFIDRHKNTFSNQGNFSIYPFWKIFVGFAALAWFILVNPAWTGSTFSITPGAVHNPLGWMVYKYIALFTITIIAALVVGSAAFILGNFEKEPDWGNLDRSPKIAAVMSGVLAMWIIITMGFVRESARAPWTFLDIIPVPGGDAYPTPLSIWNIILVWIAVLGFAITVIWYISKVTAEHPDEADIIGSPAKAWKGEEGENSE